MKSCFPVYIYISAVATQPMLKHMRKCRVIQSISVVYEVNVVEIVVAWNKGIKAMFTCRYSVGNIKQIKKN